ncbi:hypothetical protein HD806DRAFT_409828 [Xylariaceae sp. AK1471]|nr:hypothetical protein HD806DRAFT_409828 [Xylariaceae sp. AK1471]
MKGPRVPWVRARPAVQLACCWFVAGTYNQLRQLSLVFGGLPGCLGYVQQLPSYHYFSWHPLLERIPALVQSTTGQYNPDLREWSVYSTLVTATHDTASIQVGTATPQNKGPGIIRSAITSTELKTTTANATDAPPYRYTSYRS